MKHADGCVFVLAVGAVYDVITEGVLVDTDDHVGVWRRHARKQLSTVTGPRTLYTRHAHRVSTNLILDPIA